MESTEVTIWSRFSETIFEQCLNADYNPASDLYLPLKEYLAAPKSLKEWPEITDVPSEQIFPFLSTLIIIATLKQATPRVMKVFKTCPKCSFIK